VLLFASASGSPAQQPSGRIDLDLMAALPYSQLVAARVVFSKSSTTCPDDYGIVHVANGLFRHHHASVFRKIRWTAEFFRPVDDDTYRYRIATQDCRIDLAVRQQIRQT